MHVCHLITRMVAGGAQVNTLICAERQAREGYRVTLISGIETSAEGSLLEQARSSPMLEFIELPSIVREVSPFRDLLAAWQLTQLFRRLSIDVLHTHTSKAGIVGRLAAWVCRIPVVIHTPHGHVFHSYFSPLRTHLFKYCEKFLAWLCTDALVALSSGCLKDHLNEGVIGAEKMVIIPSGVPLQAFQALRRAHNSTPVVGYIGRLADIKGPLDLVEAFPSVLEHFPEARLLIVGDGPQRQLVENKLHQQNCRGKAELTGWQEDTRPYLEKMDLLVVPSHNEGMGRVVVEALAAGIPVVATEVGGLVDLVQPDWTGMLVPPQNPPGLAAGITALLSLPDRGRQMGENGRERALLFSDQVMFQRLDQLYAKIADLKGLHGLRWPKQG